MNLRQSLAVAIKAIRKSRGLTQEDFAVVSSRTYLSSLERGLKSPTIDKIDEISRVLKIHPAAVVLMAYAMQAEPGDRVSLIANISDEAIEATQNLP
jgi:transcriptional regulator with XRE-family HTH domain